MMHSADRWTAAGERLHRHYARRAVAVIVSLVAAMMPLGAGALPASDAGAARLRMAAPPFSLYLAGAGSDGVVGIDIRGAKVPREIGGSPYASGFGALAMKGTRDGRWLYKNSAAPLQEVVAFERMSTGTLRRAGTVSLTGAPLGLGLSPDGTRLFVTLLSPEASVQAFTIGPGGVPQPAGDPVPLGPGGSYTDGPVPMPAVSRDGRSLYVTGFQSAQVIRFRIKASGALSAPLQRIAADAGTVAPTVTPNGRFLYTSNEDADNVSGFRIRRSGSLTELSGSPFPVGDNPHYLSITSDNRFLYVPNVFSNDVHGLAIQRDGDLTPVPGSPFAGGPRGIFPANVAIAPGNTMAHVVTVESETGTALVHPYVIKPSGRLVLARKDGYDTGLVFAGGPITWVVPH